MFIYGTIISIILSSGLFLISIIFDISLILILLPIIMWIIFVIISFIAFLLFNNQNKTKNKYEKPFEENDHTYYQ